MVVRRRACLASRSAPHLSAQGLGIDETLTVDNTTGGVRLADATIGLNGLAQANYCVGVLETAQIRMLDNGDVPTSTVGRLVQVGDTVELYRHAHIRAAPFIRTGSTSGSIQFTCYPELPPWASRG